MDSEDRALIARLFAEITAALEDAHAAAAKGQSQKRSARTYAVLAREMTAAAHDAAVLAEAAAIIARRSHSDH